MNGNQRYRAKGLCSACGKTPAPGKKKCQPCLDKASVCRDAWVARKRAAGLCMTCGVCQPTDGKAVCDGCAEQTRLARDELREQGFAAYGAVCECCGVAEKEFLTFSNQLKTTSHRAARNAGIATWGYGFLRALRRQHFPAGAVKVHCWNCALCIAYHGICDHELERQGLPTS